MWIILVKLLYSIEYQGNRWLFVEFLFDFLVIFSTTLCSSSWTWSTFLSLKFLLLADQKINKNKDGCLWILEKIIWCTLSLLKELKLAFTTYIMHWVLDFRWLNFMCHEAWFFFISQILWIVKFFVTYSTPFPLCYSVILCYDLEISLCNLQMTIGLPEFVVFVLLALLSSLQNVFGIRFVIDREECFCHNVQYEVDTEHLSFVVIKVNGARHYTQDGVHLVVIFHVSLLKFVGFVKFLSFFSPHLHLFTSKYY